MLELLEVQASEVRGVLALSHVVMSILVTPETMPSAVCFVWFCCRVWIDTPLKKKPKKKNLSAGGKILLSQGHFC